MPRAASPAFRWERTRPDGAGGVVGTGEIREVAIQALYRAVGYFGSPLDGVPFDERHGVIPNHEGQALHPRLQRARLGRLRDRLDQARPGRAHRAHEVRRDGDRAPHHQRPGVVVAAGATRPKRRSPRCSRRAASRGPTSRAGTASTSTRWRSAPRTAAPASRWCRATRWCRSRAASSRFREAGFGRSSSIGGASRGIRPPIAGHLLRWSPPPRRSASAGCSQSRTSGRPRTAPSAVWADAGWNSGCCRPRRRRRACRASSRRRVQ